MAEDTDEHGASTEPKATVKTKGESEAPRSNTPFQSTFASLQSLRCPICSKRFVPSDVGVAMPFCSTRCKQIDLGRWLGEAYGLPYVPSEDDDEA